MRVLTSKANPLLLIVALLCLAGCSTHQARHEATPLAHALPGRSAHWLPPLLFWPGEAQEAGPQLQALLVQAPLLTALAQKRENGDAT